MLINTNVKKLSPLKTNSRYVEVQCSKCNRKFGKHFREHWKTHKTGTEPQGTVEVQCADTGKHLRISYQEWNHVRHAKNYHDVYSVGDSPSLLPAEDSSM